MSVKSFPTRVTIYRVVSGKEITGKEVARYGDCDLAKCIQTAYLNIVTGMVY